MLSTGGIYGHDPVLRGVLIYEKVVEKELELYEYSSRCLVCIDTLRMSNGMSMGCQMGCQLGCQSSDVNFMDACKIK